MQKSLSTKLFAMFIFVILMFTFTETVFSKESKENSMTKISGTITNVSPDTGKVAIKDNAGVSVSLTASSDVELKEFKAGDTVDVEYDKLSGIILSMIKHDLK